MLKHFCLGCAIIAGSALFVSPAFAQCGKASWYGAKGMVAAHRKFPIGSRVKVTNRKNGRSVVVRITNRGPFVRGRIIDVSRAAARKLGIVKSGVGRVCVAAE
jgi:rare lipoprotein A